jgi:hypothetical protein
MKVKDMLESILSDNLNESADLFKELVHEKAIKELSERRIDIAGSILNEDPYTKYIVPAPSRNRVEPNLDPNKTNDAVFHGTVQQIKHEIPSHKSRQKRTVAHIVKRILKVPHPHTVHHEPHQHQHHESFNIEEGILDSLENGIDKIRALSKSKSFYDAYKTLKVKPKK